MTVQEKTNVEFDRTKIYKVFISYCWSSQEHENWVCDLAERLMSDGIEVKYDKWDLKAGQDKNAFMESMVTDETIDKVLVICTKTYKEKADGRMGGVGTETQIISSELYNKIEQTKFIPVIAEQGEKFDSCMPIYIKSRIGFDLSKKETFEDEYEQLLRAITDRPLHRKPKRGNLPSYLFEEENSNYKTKSIIASFKNSLFRNSQQAMFLVDDFFNEFLSILSNFQLEYDDLVEPYDEVIYSKIHEMQKLRDDYVEFLNNWTKVKDIFSIDRIILFLEKIYKFSDYQGTGTFKETQTDHYKFFITELFLYTCIILLKNELYECASVLINNKYFIEQRFSANDNPSSFTCFNFRTIDSLEYRTKRLGTRLISCTADTLINRANINGNSFILELTETDLLLYYISNLKTGKCYDCWFPLTYIYAGKGRGFYNYKLNILKRLISKRHFEKIKILFEVNTIEELKQLFNKFSEEANNYMGYSAGCGHVLPLRHHINYDEIGTSI